MPGAAQHYLPAARIGQFADEPSNPLRESIVQVARRGVSRTYTQKAQNVGWQRDIYTLTEPRDIPDDFVDRTWHRAEAGLPQATSELTSSYAGRVRAETWATVLVPFAAQAFVRGRDFSTRFEERLDAMLGEDWRRFVFADNTNMARLIELQRITSTVMYAEWWVLHPPPDVPLILSDIGYVSHRNLSMEQEGYVFPLSKQAALALMRGDRRPAPVLEAPNLVDGTCLSLAAKPRKRVRSQRRFGRVGNR